MFGLVNKVIDNKNVIGASFTTCERSLEGMGNIGVLHKLQVLRILVITFPKQLVMDMSL